MSIFSVYTLLTYIYLLHTKLWEQSQLYFMSIVMWILFLNQQAQQLKQQQQQQQQLHATSALTSLPQQKNVTTTPTSRYTLQSSINDTEAMDEGISEIQSPSEHLTKHANTDPAKMRVMKVSFFAEAMEEASEIGTSYSLSLSISLWKCLFVLTAFVVDVETSMHEMSQFHLPSPVVQTTPAAAGRCRLISYPGSHNPLLSLASH